MATDTLTAPEVPVYLESELLNTKNWWVERDEKELRKVEEERRTAEAQKAEAQRTEQATQPNAKEAPPPEQKPPESKPEGKADDGVIIVTLRNGAEIRVGPGESVNIPKAQVAGVRPGENCNGLTVTLESGQKVFIPPGETTSFPSSQVAGVEPGNKVNSEQNKQTSRSRPAAPALPPKAYPKVRTERDNYIEEFYKQEKAEAQKTAKFLKSIKEKVKETVKGIFEKVQNMVSGGTEVDRSQLGNISPSPVGAKQQSRGVGGPGR